MSEGFLLFVILNLVLVGIVVHLYFYTRHKAAQFLAASRKYAFQPADDGSLELQLQQAFALDGSAVRAFAQFSDIVTLPEGRLFRTVELLDLDPHAQSFNTHWSRVAVFFPCNVNSSAIYRVEANLTVHQSYPVDRGTELATVASLFKQAGLAAPPHPLSLTFMNGKGLAYLEPPVVGSVSIDHLDYLSELAARFSSLSP